MKLKTKTTLLLLLISASVMAQIEIKTNPIGALFGNIPISAEFILNENVGLEATLGYYYKKDDTFSESSSVSGLVTTGQFKYYFNPKNGGDRFYAFPYIRYASRSFTFTDNTDEIKATYTAFGAGFGIGFKWVSDKGILLDMGLGIGKNFSGGYSYDEPGYDYSGDDVLIPINGIARLSIGYRF